MTETVSNPDRAAVPKKWADLIAAITLLSKHPAGNSPFQCSHDTLWVNADANRFTPEELTQLDEWGFFTVEDEDAGGFMSYRFGSS